MPPHRHTYAIRDYTCLWSIGVEKLLSFSLILILLLWGGWSRGYCQGSQWQGKGSETLALGNAKVVEDNVAAARQNAISSAISKGLEFYLMAFLGEKAISEHLDTLIEAVIPNAKELVENYQVLKEVQIGDKYSVLLKMKINTKLMLERLREQGLLSAEAKPIRILFLVGSALKDSVEYWWADPNDMPPLSPTELVLLRAFQDKGYDLINRTTSLPGQDVSMDMRQPNLSPDLIKRWGEVFGADVVIYGKSSIDASGEISLLLVVVSVKDGEEHCRLTRVGSSATCADTEKIVAGLEDIVTGIMPSLEACIVEAGGARKVILRKFEVTLKGLHSYAQYKKLRDFMSKEIPGVKEFRQSRIGSHYVSFEVEFEGNEDKFANLIMYHDALPVPIQGVEKREGEVTFLVGDKGEQ